MATDKIIMIITTLLEFGLSILFFSGRGAFLIAGYNTMSITKKRQYDEKALCRLMGVVMLVVGFSSVLFYLNNFYEIKYLDIIAGVILTGVTILAIIYANLSKAVRPRKWRD